MEDKKLNSYSYSRLKSFFNCKYYYYEHYYAKELPEESHGTSEFGSFDTVKHIFRINKRKTPFLINESFVAIIFNILIIIHIY